METGIPSTPPTSEPWHAKWCWTEMRLARPWNTLALFRKTVNLPDKPVSALVRVSADSRYVLWVNGRWIHMGPARCTPGNQSFDTIDLADALHAGANCIAAVVLQLGIPTAQSVYRDAAGFILDGVARTSGAAVPLSTPDGWLCRPARAWRKDVNRLSDWLGFQEHVDADGDPPDWLTPEYAAAEENGWKPPVAVAPAGGYPWTSLSPRGVPLLVGQVQAFAQVVAQFTGANARGYKVAEDVLVPFTQETRKRVKTGLENPDAILRDDDQPATLAPPPDGSFHAIVADLGRIWPANLIVNIAEAAGDEIIDVVYAQELEKSLVPSMNNGSALGDRYRCRPGPQRWESLLPRGFRYACIVFRNVARPLKIRNIAARAVRAAIEQVGAFECSDPLLNQIYQAAATTLGACMLDAHIDCPDRSQAQRWHDVRVQFRAGAWCFGDVSLLERGIAQMAQSQAPDGSLHAYPPSEDPHGRTIDSMLAWILTLWDHHVYTGRTDLLSRYCPTMERLLEFLAQHRHADGWIGGFEGFDLFLDCRELRREDASGVLNLLYLLALQAAGRIFERIGEPESARLLDAQSRALADFLHQRLWEPKLKAWRDGFEPDGNKPADQVSVHACALAILAGLPCDSPEAMCRDLLLKPMNARRGKAITPSPYFASFILDALVESKLAGEAIGLIRSRWGPMVSSGARTLWEQWDGARGSRCFGSAASPLYVLGRHVLGVSQTDAGWKRIRIAPLLGTLEFAKGTVPTPLGPIRIEWEKVAEDQLAVRVDLPEGIEAQFVGPVNQTRDLVPGASEFHT